MYYDEYLAGAKIGRFEFGSTVVVVFELKEGEKFEVVKKGKVQVGEECIKITK